MSESEAGYLYIERREIKLAAKDSMRWAVPHPMLAALVYFVIVCGISMVVGYFTNVYSGGGMEWGRFYPDRAFWHMQGGLAGTLIIFFNILMSLFNMVMSYGYQANYSLGVSRKQFSNIGSFFSGFGQPVRVLLLYILMSLFIFLWTLLLFFPGIIAWYRYRLAPYLLADNPGMGPMDAIRESKRLMRGYKWQAFVLDLSFIGWWILTPFTLFILSLWLTPYYTVTLANFYQAVLRADGRQDDLPPSPDPDNKW